jgi:hypothetical protein
MTMTDLRPNLRTPSTSTEILAAEGRAAGPVTLTSLPQVVNLDLYRGDDFALRLTVNDPDEETAADLSGAVVRAQLRTSSEADSTAGEFMVEIVDNVITLRLAAETSAALPGSLVWDVELDQNDWVVTLIGGRVTVTPDVTR